MLHKCSTNCIWKGLRPVNDLQGYCRCCHLIGHIRFLLFFHCKYISIWHRVEILTLICQKIKMSRDLDHTHLGGGAVCRHRTTQRRWKDPRTPVGKHGASQLYLGASNSSAGNGWSQKLFKISSAGIDARWETTRPMTNDCRNPQCWPVWPNLFHWPLHSQSYSMF